MAIPPIAWGDFSWEAFSTLIGAGVAAAAVGGAVWVGLRQAGIADRQSRILEQQVGLEELKLRHDLFERRMGVHDDARAFLLYIVQHADVPSLTDALTTGYLTALDRARFLFRPQVYDDLKEIWDQAGKYHSLRSTMKAQNLRGDLPSTAHTDREHELSLWLTGKFQQLADLFGDELRLGH